MFLWSFLLSFLSFPLNPFGIRVVVFMSNKNERLIVDEAYY